LCGRAGVYALGAVVANYRGDNARLDLFLDLFFEVSFLLSSQLPKLSFDRAYAFRTHGSLVSYVSVLSQISILVPRNKNEFT